MPQDLRRGVKVSLSFGSEVLLQVKVVNSAHPMVVNLRVHLIAGQNERLEGVNAVSLNRDLQSAQSGGVLLQRQALDHAPVVESTIIDPAVVGISQQVVGPIGVHLARDNVPQKL